MPPAWGLSKHLKMSLECLTLAVLIHCLFIQLLLLPNLTKVSLLFFSTMPQNQKGNRSLPLSFNKKAPKFNEKLHLSLTPYITETTAKKLLLKVQKNASFSPHFSRFVEGHGSGHCCWICLEGFHSHSGGFFRGKRAYYSCT